MRTHINGQKLAKPALVLLYGGNSNERVFPLTGDALIIGKHRGCDIVLNAPDVSYVHCVISRLGGSHSVRDCASRAGVRVNGDRVRSATLHDDDILNVGPFSFRVVLPPTTNTTVNDARETPMTRLERKRYNLARLALHYRQRVHELEQQKKNPERGEVRPPTTPDEEDLEQTRPTVGPPENVLPSVT